MADLQTIHSPEDVASGNGYTNGGSQSPDDERANGKANGHHNGHTNDHTNGQTNGHTNGRTNGQLVVTTDEAQNGSANGQSNGHSDGKQNGAQNGKQNPHNGLPFHGGPADGLPVSTQNVESAQQADAEAEQLMLLAGDELVELTTVLESLLFVAGEAVPAADLAKSLNLKAEEVETGLQLLAAQYKERGSGLRVQAYNGQYQLVTAPPTAPFVEDFLNIDVSTKLSRAALETLAIIAYRQPATRVQVEAVRGVDCSGVLRSLTARGLIEEVGRQDVVGRPILYGVTDLFMQHFGLTEIGELPPLGEEDADLLHAATELAEESPADEGTEAVPAG